MDGLLMRNAWKLSKAVGRILSNRTRCALRFHTTYSHLQLKSNYMCSPKIPVISKIDNPLFFVITREYAKRGGSKSKILAKKGSVVRLRDDEILDVIDVHDYRNKLQTVIEKMKSDFVAQLSTRTSVGALESIPINIEGKDYSLNELAQISRKNPNLISLNLAGFPEGLKPVIEAISLSGLGLNPQQEGTMIYLPIPKVTREFREKLSKQAKTMHTKSKDNIKQIQNSFVKEAKDKTQLPEDLVFNAQQTLTAIADDFVTEAEKILKTKQKDLLGDES